MIIEIILLSIAFIALTIGSITDIKTREVPDWINYSIIFSGIGLRLLYSSITFDWSIFLEGMLGLGAFMILGYIMFYSGQWGGGDSKMLMGLGALIGLRPTTDHLPLVIIFLINILIIGAIYGILYTIILAVLNKKKMIAYLKKTMQDKNITRFRKIKLIILTLAVVIIISLSKAGMITIPISIMLFGLLIIAYLSFYLFIFIRTVESIAMIRSISPEDLTEGDWIAKDIFIEGKRIAGPKDLGIGKTQIKSLIELKKKGKLATVKVKYGIPFIPSFFIAYIISIMFGAWWIYII